MYPLEKDYTITRHVCPRNCYDTCSILAYTYNGVLQKVEGDPFHDYTNGKLCAKGYTYVNQVYSSARIRYPLYQLKRGSGNWQRITWEEAVTIIATKILELNKRYGSNLALALNKYSGNFGILHYAVEGMFNGLGPTTRVTGSPCWSAGLDAHYYHFGGFQNSDPKDMTKAKLIILWGVNPAWTAVHSMPYIYEAKGRGAKLIVIDPIYTTTAKKSDLYFQVRPGSDGALALALSKYLVQKGLHDQYFLNHFTAGWPEFASYLAEFKLEEAAVACGLKVSLIAELAELIAAHKPVFIWTGFGLQRHIAGGQNIRAIAALGAIAGNIGIPGGGVHFAHQSTAIFTYSILNYCQAAYQQNRLININNFAPELKNLANPPVKLLWLACRNLLTQDPRPKELLRLLRDMELIVTVDLFLTPTAAYSDIVLPATTQFEALDVVPGYWHHWVGINQQAIQPLLESKSDLEIAQLLSRKLNQLTPGFCKFPQTGTAEDFLEKEFNSNIYSMLGITHWSELINRPRRANIPFTAWKGHSFPTSSKKFEFYSAIAKNNNLPPLPSYQPGLAPTPEYPYWLLTPHPQHGLNSQFQNLEWMLKSNPEPLIFVNPKTARDKGLPSGVLAQVFNGFGQVVAKVKISGDIAPDILVCYQGWFPDHDFNVNNLVPGLANDMGKVSTGANGMAFYDVFVDIKKV